MSLMVTVGTIQATLEVTSFIFQYLNDCEGVSEGNHDKYQQLDQEISHDPFLEQSRPGEIAAAGQQRPSQIPSFCTSKQA